MAFRIPRFRLSRLHVETLELPQDGAEERQMRRGADQLLRSLALHADHAWSSDMGWWNMAALQGNQTSGNGKSPKTWEYHGFLEYGCSATEHIVWNIRFHVHLIWYGSWWLKNDSWWHMVILWYDMIWYDMIWCDMIWYEMRWDEML